jgi:nitrite reductase (NADH) small subunit
MTAVSGNKKYLACSVAELLEKGRLIVTVKGMEVGHFQVNGQTFAWRNVCPHAAAPVCKGVVCGTRMPSLVYEYEYGRDQEVLRCPWHGWEFDLRTGRHLADEAVNLRGLMWKWRASRSACCSLRVWHRIREGAEPGTGYSAQPAAELEWNKSW